MNDDDFDLSIFPPPVRREPCQLYLISPQDVGGAFPDRLKAALGGGAVAALQLRVKDVDNHELARLAEPIQRICGDAGTTFIVNDDCDLALSVGADGVHIGRDDGDADAISRIRHRSTARTQGQSAPFMIGVSCYNEFPRAESAVAAGADYIAFGSFFSSLTKPTAAHADVALIREAKARFAVPIVAIGGITVENAQQLIAAKVDAVAVITALFDAGDIELRARQFTNLFKSIDHVHQ